MTLGYFRHTCRNLARMCNQVREGGVRGIDWHATAIELDHRFGDCSAIVGGMRCNECPSILPFFHSIYIPLLLYLPLLEPIRLCLFIITGIKRKPTSITPVHYID